MDNFLKIKTFESYKIFKNRNISIFVEKSNMVGVGSSEIVVVVTFPFWIESKCNLTFLQVRACVREKGTAILGDVVTSDRDVLPGDVGKGTSVSVEYRNGHLQFAVTFLWKGIYVVVFLGGSHFSYFRLSTVYAS